MLVVVVLGSEGAEGGGWRRRARIFSWTNSVTEVRISMPALPNFGVSFRDGFDHGCVVAYPYCVVVQG